MEKIKEWLLVTGGSRGIGEALVRHLAQNYHIVFTWKYEKEQAEVLERDCLNQPGKVEGFCCDGTSKESVNQLAMQLLAERGPPFGVIHNAGITRDSLHIHQTAEDWALVIDTNLNAIFNWHQYILPAMVAQGRGSIILMSSVSAVKGNIGQVAYSATKAAMTGITRSLALEVARFGIRVNCLLPGVIETEMVQKLSADERKILRSNIPLRRFGQPAEIAQAAGFLLSDASSYITGQSIIIDGGLTA